MLSNKIFTCERIGSGPSLTRDFVILCFFLCSSLACQTHIHEATNGTSSLPTDIVAGPPKVRQVTDSGLKDLLKPTGKPLLINFWATWCGPCREEFPDLVKIGSGFRDKVDLITVSLDDISEIDTEVPKFLAEMSYNSPAYLLKTSDEDAAMALVSKDWQGGLPFTILINANGETVYARQGKFKTEELLAEIEKLTRTH